MTTLQFVLFVASVGLNIILGVVIFGGLQLVKAQKDCWMAQKNLVAALEASLKAENSYSKTLEGVIAKDYSNASLKLLQESVGRGTPEHLKPQTIPFDRGWRSK